MSSGFNNNQCKKPASLNHRVTAINHGYKTVQIILRWHLIDWQW